MNKNIDKLNFKKIIVTYIVSLVVFVSVITIFLGNKYDDKLNYLYNYHKISELMDEKYNREYIEEILTKLTKSSNDVVDIVITNRGNVIYSTTNVYGNNLTEADSGYKYYKDDDGNIYKLENKEEFIFSLFSIDNEKDYYDEFNIDHVDYLMTYLKSNKTNDKIIFINKIVKVEHGLWYIKIALAILALFFMLYWIITSLMVYQNARAIKLNSYFWGILTLFTNIIGVIIYLIYIKNRINCDNCHTSNSKSSIYCVNCGNKINECCKKCQAVINKGDKYCRSCGEKL